MKRLNFILMVLIVPLLSSRAAPPEGLELPLVVHDVDFNGMTVGKPPPRADKETMENYLENPWKLSPRTTHDQLDYVTRTRTAMVVDAACGLTDQPLLFEPRSNHHPTWGPRMRFQLPRELQKHAGVVRVQVDVSKCVVSAMGGFRIDGIGSVLFTDSGVITFEKTMLGIYRPGVPVHLDIRVDLRSREVFLRLDDEAPVRLDWPEKARGVHGVRLDGLLPGGLAHPSRIAFDNLRISIEALR